MITIEDNDGVFISDGSTILSNDRNTLNELNNIKKNQSGKPFESLEQAKQESSRNTIAAGILGAHNTGSAFDEMNIRFDVLASHDITYTGIIQTARASGLKEFPLPYVLTNCHNSLAAVGGTINEDDHSFGLSAAEKYGGIFVPPHLAVIHQYIREMMSGCGKMILGSDSHTRYGALGTMGFGEGGPELVKQLLGKTYDVKKPDVIAVYLEGVPVPGVGPQDVAIALTKEVFESGFVKNKVLEFIGPGVSSLSVDFRNGIDVMTTETTCLSSIWMTDKTVEEYYSLHGRRDAFAALAPGSPAWYDGVIRINLGAIRPMIALPFHPSNAYTIKEFLQNADDILDGIEVKARKQFENPDLNMDLRSKTDSRGVRVDQAVIAGCAGGSYENIAEASRIIDRTPLGTDNFSLSVYPASQPVYLELIRRGYTESLMKAGAVMRSAFCGPCFGAGDTPHNKGLSVRHTTRNFPNREGSKPDKNQIASVALMDARSIAATAAAGGYITPATDIVRETKQYSYSFNSDVYANRVKNRTGKPQSAKALFEGPNIVPWPEMTGLSENLLLRFTAVIHDPVTTTDELIPSGETSSYRSNPMGLAEYTLSRRVPDYVARSKAVKTLEESRTNAIKNNHSFSDELSGLHSMLQTSGVDIPDDAREFYADTSLGSLMYANKPGDGSAREQAASCQKVLGGWANIARDYATKRYRSNVINWGMLPFIIRDENVPFKPGGQLYIPGIKTALQNGQDEIKAVYIDENNKSDITIGLPGISQTEREIILAGCLINYYRGA